MRTGSKLATIFLTTGLTLAGFAGMAGSARAATGGTTTTFTLTAGALTVAPPAASVLGTANAGAATISGSLGVVTVADLRGALSNGWSNTVSSTTFALTGGGGTGNETVAIADIAYSTGAGTVTANGTFTAGSLANGGLPGVAGTHSAGSGISTTTWNPTVTLTLLGSQVAGTYSGTITHSIA